MVDVVGDASLGNFLVQSLATTPFSARYSTSVVVLKVTTSAASPSATARDCALDPPCDWSTFTSMPLVFL
ncbi:hypothetical protein D3C72_2586280 [compost metagenome]